MSTKIIKLPIFVVITLLLFVFATTAYSGLAFADTEEVFYVQSVTSIDENGERSNFNYSKYENYGSNIIVTYATTYSYLSLTIYDDGVAYGPFIEYAENGVVEYVVKNEGKIEIAASAYSADNELMGDSINITVYNDNVADFSISSNESVFDEYTDSPFYFEYEIVQDEDNEVTGIDGVSSYYTIEIDGEIASYFLKNETSGSLLINSNCIITFYVYDNVGNLFEKQYIYDKYGYPDCEIPTVTLNNNGGYVTSVTVTISWGEEYDAHPAAPKYYKISNSSGDSSLQEYTGSFEVNTNNSVIAIIYYVDGLAKYYEYTITCIDSVAPSSSMLMNNFNISCDLTEEYPIVITVSIQDYESGINKVYLSTGEELTRVIDNTYMVRISSFADFVIYAEDYVGLKASYGYSFATFDNTTLLSYNAIYNALDSDLYSTLGWSTVISSFNALSNYLFSDNQSTSTIAGYCRAIDEAIVGDIIVTTVFNKVPTGLSIMDFTVPASSTNLLLGDTATIFISTIALADSVIDDYILQGSILAGYSDYNGYSLSLSIIDSTGENVVISDEILLEILLPNSATIAEVFCLDKSGSLVELASYISDGYINATAYDVGNFFLICKYTEIDYGSGIWVGNAFYSTSLILSTIAVVIAIAVVAFVAGIIIYRIVDKRKRKH